MSAATQWPNQAGRNLEGEVLTNAFAVCPQSLAVMAAGRILQANRAFVRAAGFTSDAEVLDKTLSELVSRGTAALPSRTYFTAGGRDFELATFRDALPEPGSQRSPGMETLGRLVGSVAHDFNNLLTGILLYCDLLIAGLENHPDLQRQVKEMRTAGHQGSELVRQLLVLARHQPVQARTLSWNDAISAMRNFLGRLVGENIELTTNLGATLGPVEMDSGQMQQVILNLVLNARDAMPEGGQIVLATSNRDRHTAPQRQQALVGFQVSDTGHGMDDETRLHVFEPFFSTKASGRGSGLGLATVHEIVAQHEGTIEVESAPGKGTSVTIRMPRAGAGTSS